MAPEDLTGRVERVCGALEEAAVPYALAGGQAVAIWVATNDPAAVRTTKSVDILPGREDFPRARAAASKVGLEYFELMGVGMFLDRADPHPRQAVRLVGPVRRSGRTTKRLRRRSTGGKRWPPASKSSRCLVWCR